MSSKPYYDAIISENTHEGHEIALVFNNAVPSALLLARNSTSTHLVPSGSVPVGDPCIDTDAVTSTRMVVRFP